MVEIGYFLNIFKGPVSKNLPPWTNEGEYLLSIANCSRR